jgi:general secretion pathway protein A
MDYFSILNLNREPFSNSPDPDYFYHSQQHLDCLQKLELSLHLRRGMNVIIGEVGTGKTTLCRQLIRRFAQRREIETHLILDPLFKDGADFLATVIKLLSGKKMPDGTTEWQAKEFIKHSLFRKGVDQKKITVLIIDEGQKIPVFCLELLREFLNYETNEYKLLQIVIFAQSEFETVIRQHPNFGDRINLFHRLKPLSFRDTRMMISYRLERSSATPQKQNFFTLPALLAIYRTTGGYPRKIINLCHQCILAMIIQNKSRVEYRLVRRCATRVVTAERPRRRWPATAMAASVLIAVLLWAVFSDRWPLVSGLRATLATAKRPPALETMKLPPQTAPAAETALAAAPAETTEAPSSTAAAPASSASSPAPAAESSSFKPPQAQTPPTTPFEPDITVSPAGPSWPPEMLGILKLKRNETISGLIQKVYGGYSHKHFRSLILANPTIDNPDIIDVGRTIRLPAVPVGVKPLNKDAWWVKIGDWPELQEAFEVLRTYPDSAAPVRLVPCWQPTTGLRFVIVLKQLFSSRDEAQLQLNAMPSNLAPSGQVIRLWDERTVFFADPYQEVFRTR